MAKRYYWLKLNENFFEREEIKIIETMQNGERYIIFYLKLLLKSIRCEGRLMFRGIIPYTPEMLASITNTDVDTVKVAVKIFEDLGLLRVLDDQALFMNETQNMIGSETEWAKKKREQRLKSGNLITSGEDNVQDVSSNCPTEIDIDKELDKDIEIDKELIVSKDTIVTQEQLTSIINTWNSLNLQRIVSIQNNRLKLLKARIKEHGLDTVLNAIESIKESSFLKGQNNKSWTITFDWFVKPNNFIKVLEGNYMDKDTNARQDNKNLEYEPF